MKNLMISLFLTSFIISGVAYGSCEDASITQKSSDGAVIFLDNGSVWEISQIDRINSTLWLVTDNVLACDDGYIVHKENGEKVDATKLR